MLVDALLGSRVSGSSLPRVTRRTCWSASSAAGEAEAEAAALSAGVEAAGLSAGVEAAGEALLVEPPQAVTIITPAASRPSSRFCINCFLRTGGYPNVLPQTRPFPCVFHVRPVGPAHGPDRDSHSIGFQGEPRRQHSSGRCAAGTI